MALFLHLLWCAGLPGNLQTRSTPRPECSELHAAKAQGADGDRSASSTGTQDLGPSGVDAVEGTADDEEDLFHPEPLISPFVPVWGLQDIPLLGVQNMGTLTLKWDDPATGGATEMVFHVDSITRSHSGIVSGAAIAGSMKTTTLLLSSGHKFVVKDARAELYDPAGRLVHIMLRSPHSSLTEATSLLDASGTRNNSTTVDVDNTQLDNTPNQPALRKRRLQFPGDGFRGGMKKPKRPKGFAPALLPNGPPAKGGGPPTSFMDAYCRYGCGGMSVTFPYYYRPFFGYGFPLVGTEAMFPQGYGGYAAAPLLATQGGMSPITGAGGPMIAGGLPGGALTPGLGGTTVVGGVQPVALPLPGF